MKITYITHACLLVETDGLRILTDPWIAGPSWGGNIWVYPPAKTMPEELVDIDVIYFSHAHEDHFQRECVDRLPACVREEALVLLPDFEMPYFQNAVMRAGFKNIKVMGHNESVDLSDTVRLHMLINDQGDHDSAVVLEAEGSSVFMQTDSLISVDEARRIRKLFDIDLMFTITIMTGIYPAFCDIDANTVIQKAEQKRANSREYALRIAEAIRPKYAVPYASDLCYLGELFHINILHHHDKEAYLSELSKRNLGVEGIRMGPDDCLEIVNGTVIDRSIGKIDDSYERLATYAIEMRDRVHQSWLEEHSRIEPFIDKLVEHLAVNLEKVFSGFPEPHYHVLWRVTEDDGQCMCIGHAAGGGANIVEDDWPYDLRIDVPAFRLRRLAHGDYPMGFLTLQNGCVRFHRHVENFTDEERNYWNKLLHLRLYSAVKK
ncbi:MBL fold metallo-hydrolase [Thalassospira sp.]|uniref:MBL fold metallo-hydrolase n=1 Tax=Thalassospira sp. TaxID=1912094 RepID=UPI001B0181B8|nr:MBL fold metallo-hydrolase [Thalassospira sp.]MBO6805962.1 MBL fold metallo-hydrolase [Thalassospira sp.]